MIALTLFIKTSTSAPVWWSVLLYSLAPTSIYFDSSYTCVYLCIKWLYKCFYCSYVYRNYYHVIIPSHDSHAHLLRGYHDWHTCLDTIITTPQSFTRPQPLPYAWLRGICRATPAGALPCQLPSYLTTVDYIYLTLSIFKITQCLYITHDKCRECTFWG
jgi:hypothetical protein